MRSSPPLTALAALAQLAALALAGAIAPPAGAATRHYWVAAVPVDWTVVPNGRDAIHGTRFAPGETDLATVVYRRFTRNWRRPVREPGGDHRQGVVGPILRARVGDRVRVHFRNLDTRFDRPHSMHFHGLHYRPGSDGSYVPGFSGPGGAVPPGGEFTYRLRAGDASRGVWSYHDHSPSMEASIAGGLYGALIVRGRRERPPDREFVSFLGAVGGLQTINGRAFVGNTPVLHARVGDRVEWNVLSLGDDFHTFHVHGHRWRRPDGTPEDTRTIGPAESFAVRWRERHAGTWLYHCHVEAHMMQGMIGLYRVRR